MMGDTGSSRRGRLKSFMSTSSNSASVRFCAISWTHLATASPLRPGCVLPMMMAILNIDFPSLRSLKTMEKKAVHNSLVDTPVPIRTVDRHGYRSFRHWTCRQFAFALGANNGRRYVCAHALNFNNETQTMA